MASKSDRKLYQRLIGVGQIIGGLLSMYYGSGWGGGGGGTYLLGSGIANVGGSRYGTGGPWVSSGKSSDMYKGFFTDLAGYGAGVGIGKGVSSAMGGGEENQTPDVYSPVANKYQTLLAQLTAEGRQRQMQAEQTYQGLQDYFMQGGT